MVEKPISIILMKCDNETLITKVISSKDNMKSSRHVKRQLKSVRKLRSSLVIALDYIPITENLTDQFTKGLSRSVINNVKVHLVPLVDFG
jgi:lysyl-tRNA synthetase class I